MAGQGLLNYTTQIAADKTASEIQSILARAGAKAIMAEYDGAGLLVGIRFLIDTAFGERAFTLPANPEPVGEVLHQQWIEGKVPRKYVTPEQAARVAWRIIKSWVEAQVALIQTEMVSLEQVMLPYMATPSGQTVYELMREQHLALPKPGDSDD